MEKLKDIALAKRILKFLAKRIGAEKIEPYSINTSIILTSVHRTKNKFTWLDEALHYQIYNIVIKSSKSFADPDECLLALVNQMFEKAQTKDIITAFNNKIVLHRYECLENILIEMELNA